MEKFQRQFSHDGYLLNEAADGVIPLEVARHVASQMSQHGDDRPFFIMNADQVLAQHLEWQRLMPRIHQYYAVKCNSDPILLRLLASYGCNFDCASKGEINMVLKIQGVTPNRIIYANPCKNRNYIQHAANSGVDMMTFDNAEELYKIKSVHPNAQLVIRIAVSDPTAMCQLNVKFGCEPHVAAPNLMQMAADIGANVVGVSFHVGSGCRDPTAYANGIAIARKLFDLGEAMGHKMRIVDIGGGFPGTPSAAITFPRIAQVVNEALDVYFPPEDTNVQIIGEPGRYYAAATFTLCCKIIAKTMVPATRIAKNGDCTETDGCMYYINDGVYGSFNGILYDHLHPKGMPLYETGANEKLSSIWGPTCDGLDVVLPECRLPEMQEGDWMIFPQMGAYSLAAGSEFNGFPRAAVHYWGSILSWGLMNPAEQTMVEEKADGPNAETKNSDDSRESSRCSSPLSVSSEDSY